MSKVIIEDEVNEVGSSLTLRSGFRLFLSFNHSLCITPHTSSWVVFRECKLYLQYTLLVFMSYMVLVVFTFVLFLLFYSDSRRGVSVATLLLKAVQDYHRNPTIKEFVDTIQEQVCISVNCKLVIEPSSAAIIFQKVHTRAIIRDKKRQYSRLFVTCFMHYFWWALPQKPALEF